MDDARVYGSSHDAVKQRLHEDGSFPGFIAFVELGRDSNDNRIKADWTHTTKAKEEGADGSIDDTANQMKRCQPRSLTHYRR